MAFVSVNTLLNRAFYSIQKPWLPLIMGVVNLALNAGLMLLLYKPLGVGGITLATSLVSMFNFFALMILLRPAHRRGGRAPGGLVGGPVDHRPHPAGGRGLRGVVGPGRRSRSEACGRRSSRWAWPTWPAASPICPGRLGAADARAARRGERDPAPARAARDRRGHRPEGRGRRMRRGSQAAACEFGQKSPRIVANAAVRQGRRSGLLPLCLGVVEAPVGQAHQEPRWRTRSAGTPSYRPGRSCR